MDRIKSNVEKIDTNVHECKQLTQTASMALSTAQTLLQHYDQPTLQYALAHRPLDVQEVWGGEERWFIGIVTAIGNGATYDGVESIESQCTTGATFIECIRTKEARM
jgi:hypothetical protein